MVLVWRDLWVLQKRQGMVLVVEICEYHSRGYGVISERPVGTTARLEGYGICPEEACLCQLLIDNLLRIIRYHFVRNCIVLDRNNVMSVLAPI